MFPSRLIASLLFLPALIIQSFSNPFDCGALPELNKEIIAFVKPNVKKKIGRGECWDLAAAALNSAGADWDGKYGFGRKIDLKKECVFPGDIIQMEGVRIKYSKDNAFYEENMQHHTVVIYEVKTQDSFVIAEQNTSYAGRKVSLNALELKNITRGKYTIYRPQKKS
jgi:hypothetical protein